jgi:hypothetical protein
MAALFTRGLGGDGVWTGFRANRLNECVEELQV